MVRGVRVAEVVGCTPRTQLPGWAGQSPYQGLVQCLPLCQLPCLREEGQDRVSGLGFWGFSSPTCLFCKEVRGRWHTEWQRDGLFTSFGSKTPWWVHCQVSLIFESGGTLRLPRQSETFSPSLQRDCLSVPASSACLSLPAESVLFPPNPAPAHALRVLCFLQLFL